MADKDAEAALAVINEAKAALKSGKRASFKEDLTAIMAKMAPTDFSYIVLHNAVLVMEAAQNTIDREAARLERELAPEKTPEDIGTPVPT